ncbi:hypothetical protein [Kitasatospora kifunensis]|uniref:Uncharacterized protein n=1 Tax=Kitasatospora kifunensis TaxID=58351 RepID=A0A7W7R970_KITKI|nr:hypothetical protein [Kitasatospora kifunensis]MBB4927443.1 hypothetical protein [Kitasatospora kifunensis]
MMIKKAATIVAATLLASVPLAGMASAQTARPSRVDQTAYFSGYGPTRADAIEDASDTSAGAGCNPNLIGLQTGQESNGTWWAVGYTYCAVN